MSALRGGIKYLILEENMLKNMHQDFCKGGESFYAQNSG